MKVTGFQYTDPGSREINEDSVGLFLKEDRFLAVLADGLGGHGKGDAASQLVVEACKQFFLQEEPEEFSFEKMFVYANDQLLKKKEGLADRGQMMTTLVAVAGIGKELHWCHCGDSRFYLFKKGRLLQRTLDHSLPQMLVASGQIKEREIRNHPDRNKLLKCLGYVWEDGPLCETGGGYTISGGETILLCSDGFWEYILERQMCFIDFWEKETEKKLAKMKNRVVERSQGRNADNRSAVLLRVDRDDE